MDEAQVRALFEQLLGEQLTPAIQGALDVLQGHLDSQVSSLRGELASKPQQTSEQPDVPSGTIKERLANLEAMLVAEKAARVEAEKARADAEKAAKEAEVARQFDQQFDSLLSQYNIVPETREWLVKSLKGELAGAELVDGKFILKDGKELSEYLGGFMGSPVGQHFLQNQGNVNGLATFATTDKPATTQTPMTEQSVLSAFL